MGEQIQLKNNLVMLGLRVVPLIVAEMLEVEMKGQGQGRTSCFSSMTSLH